MNLVLTNTITASSTDLVNKMNKQEPSYDQLKQETLSYLPDNPREAFKKFRWILSYPGEYDISNDLLKLKDALIVFSQISQLIVNDEFALIVTDAANECDNESLPNRGSKLYKLGFELYEQHLFEIAATVLSAALKVAKNNATLQIKCIGELSASLEAAGRNESAIKVMEEYRDLVEKDGMLLYLLAFNYCWSGDLESAKKIFPKLQKCNIHESMLERIEGYLQRADVLKSAKKEGSDEKKDDKKEEKSETQQVQYLSNKDLRGWNFVFTGTILTHISPFGMESMSGRYAWVQDSEALILEGIHRLATILKELKISPKQVFAIPQDKPSNILAHAVSSFLKCPLVNYSDANMTEPGLVVVYDLAKIPDDIYKKLWKIVPGQILYAHADNWTTEGLYRADITTLEYQFIAAPWDSQMKINPKADGKNEVEKTPPKQASVQQLAQEILDTKLEENCLDDLEELKKFVRVISKTSKSEHGAALFKTKGNRHRKYYGGPVKSSRFI